MTCFKLNRMALSMWVVCMLAFLTMIWGCGSGGSSSAGLEGAEDGGVVVSLTDAAGDFLSYTVDVMELTLTGEDGQAVTVLPLTTRVDFAQYTELCEFLTASMVPQGTYVEASMTLSYENAEIYVEGEDGEMIRMIPYRPLWSIWKPSITGGWMPMTSPVRVSMREMMRIRRIIRSIPVFWILPP